MINNFFPMPRNSETLILVERFYGHLTSKDKSLKEHPNEMGTILALVVDVNVKEIVVVVELHKMSRPSLALELCFLSESI